jgi:methylglutamate dehydrogenase subunit D
VTELAARDALDGLGLPLAIGDVRLGALDLGRLTSVAPFRGREAEVGAALGGALPPPGGLARVGEGRVLWSGIGQWFVQGPVPDLVGLAALSDQSDAWVGLQLSGPAAADVLARLAPLDLHPDAFPPGSVARTLLRHLACLLVAGADGFEILVMRSFARSAVHDLTGAMRAVAGRAALTGPGWRL